MKNMKSGIVGSLIVTALFVVAPTVGASPTDCLDLQEEAARGPADQVLCLIDATGEVARGDCDTYDTVSVYGIANEGGEKHAGAWCGGPSGVGSMVASCTSYDGVRCDDSGSTTSGNLFCSVDDADGHADCSVS